MIKMYFILYCVFVILKKFLTIKTLKIFYSFLGVRVRVYLYYANLSNIFLAFGFIILLFLKIPWNHFIKPKHPSFLSKKNNLSINSDEMSIFLRLIINKFIKKLAAGFLCWKRSKINSYFRMGQIV